MGVERGKAQGGHGAHRLAEADSVNPTGVQEDGVGRGARSRVRRAFSAELRDCGLI